MPILKRRLDICGRERTWEYLVEAAGRHYRVTAHQIGRSDPSFECSCGASSQPGEAEPLFFAEMRSAVCSHISEAQRDLSIARQAAAQMVP